MGKIWTSLPFSLLLAQILEIFPFLYFQRKSVGLSGGAEDLEDSEVRCSQMQENNCYCTGNHCYLLTTGFQLYFQNLPLDLQNETCGLEQEDWSDWDEMNEMNEINEINEMYE